MFSLVVSAQEGKKSNGYIQDPKKLGFTAADSLFQMNLGFRIQSRAGFEKEEGAAGVVDAQVRRMRLKMDGFVYNPKFGYKVELGFSAKDMATIDGKNGNTILDAVLFYHPAKNWTVAFGQTKLPGNNQRVISSGSLEFTDRTINNSSFNIDRDFGLFVKYAKEDAKQFSYNLQGAVTKGEGRNWVGANNDGIALTGKVELFPLGAFTKHGSLIEGDIYREKSLKWMISGAFSQNNNGLRAQGQLGSNLTAETTMQSLFFDTMLKYNGWAASAAYMSRMADDPANKAYLGEGIDTQLSYVFPSNYSIAGRFSTQTLDTDYFVASGKPNTDEFAVSVSKYILGHKLKVQTEFSYETTEDNLGATSNTWYLRGQVEIGL